MNEQKKGPNDGAVNVAVKAAVKSKGKIDGKSLKNAGRPLNRHKDMRAQGAPAPSLQTRLSPGGVQSIPTFYNAAIAFTIRGAGPFEAATPRQAILRTESRFSHCIQNGRKDVTQFLIDNILLLAIILVCVITLAAPYFTKRRYGPQVDSTQATELINHQGAQIVDLRDPKEFKKEAIARSINIPADRIQNEFERLKKDKPVLLVDEDNRRTKLASPLLRGLGFNVFVLEGGLQAWRRAGLPFSR